jgi:hypothetical protein
VDRPSRTVLLALGTLALQACSASRAPAALTNSPIGAAPRSPVDASAATIQSNPASERTSMDAAGEPSLAITDSGTVAPDGSIAGSGLRAAPQAYSSPNLGSWLDLHFEGGGEEYIHAYLTLADDGLSVDARVDWSCAEARAQARADEGQWHVSGLSRAVGVVCAAQDRYRWRRGAFRR